MRFDKSFLEVNSRKCACLYSSFKGTFCLCPTCIPFPSFLPSFLRDLNAAVGCTRCVESADRDHRHSRRQGKG